MGRKLIVLMLNKLGLGYGGVANATVLIRNLRTFLGEEADVRCSREWENKVEIEINVADETVYLEYTLDNGKITHLECPEDSPIGEDMLARIGII